MNLRNIYKGIYFILFINDTLTFDKSEFMKFKMRGKAILELSNSNKI